MDTDPAPKQIHDLRDAAAAAREGNEPMVRTYILVGGKPARGKRGVMRAGGPPIGVTEQTRPKWIDGKFMHHLVTLDLDAMPALRDQHPELVNARAVAVFIDDAMDNEAFDAGTQETKIVILSEQDVARGEWTGPEVDDPKPRPLAAWPVDVPDRVYDYDPYGTDDEPDEAAPIYIANRKLMSGNRAGGRVIHWSGDDRTAGWLFQFTEDIVDVNLGDGGTMYVFLDRAYWHCH